MGWPVPCKPKIWGGLGTRSYRLVLDVGGVQYVAGRVYNWKTDKVRAGRVVIGPALTRVRVLFVVLLWDKGHVV
jgi:hypothetical protein